MKEELVRHMLHRLSNSVGTAINDLYLLEDNGPEPLAISLHLVKAELVLFRHLMMQESGGDVKKDLERILAAKSIKLLNHPTTSPALIALLMIFAECAQGGELEIGQGKDKITLTYSQPLPQTFRRALKENSLAQYLPNIEFPNSNTCRFTTS